MKTGKCIICDKPTREGTNVCSSACLHNRGKIAQSGRSIESVFKVMNKDSLNTKTLQEVSMIVLKHARLRRRNVSCAGVNFSFDENGFSRFLKLEPAFSAAAILVKFSKGAISFVEEAIEEVVKPVVEPKKVDKVAEIKKELKEVVAKKSSKELEEFKRGWAVQCQAAAKDLEKDQPKEEVEAPVKDEKHSKYTYLSVKGDTWTPDKLETFKKDWLDKVKEVEKVEVSPVKVKKSFKSLDKKETKSKKSFGKKKSPVKKSKVIGKKKSPVKKFK